MLPITKKYIDFNGVEREETFYFNLTKAELAEWELGVTGGLSKMVEKITAAKDVPALAKLFKEVVLKAYGVKSDDRTNSRLSSRRPRHIPTFIWNWRRMIRKLRPSSTASFRKSIK